MNTRSRTMFSLTTPLWILAIVVDGLMIHHPKGETSDDINTTQQLRGQASSRMSDANKTPRGISVNVVSILVDGDQSESSSSYVFPGALNSSTATVVTNTEQQCRVVSEKIDCASYGIKKTECVARGCCYSEVHDGLDPWCYLPETSLVSQCQGREESRLQCGYYNIERDECNKLGCCWRPTSTSGTPWCYQADSKTPTLGEEGSDTFQCGEPFVEPNVNLRIVGGNEAVPHSWPWMVSLQWSQLSEAEEPHLCGGSLINDRWVVSAAHCYDKNLFEVDVADLSIVVGIHKLDSPDSILTERFAIEKIITHPKYQILNGNSVSNDIMLIKLARPVKFNRAVLPICLPRHHQTIESGTRCWTTGWGTTLYLGNISLVLKQVALPQLDRDVCNQKDWYDNKVDDTNICAGYHEGGESACHGDSGGPLACHVEGHWILYGIVSWGDVCAQEKKPVNFANAPAYIKWIQREIKENSD